ncbi:hypothetical protein TELCIR_11318 [Teladorsagia circumcincta]|uniref:Uncharacterized protein n=1 Tax=Teladorsagia circumcincta TaxID=45464 RepID=A0A2G9UB25_TELCI|nr:hypothetical protein TELCIR_11318 [Teladorsagia circumcincta]
MVKPVPVAFHSAESFNFAILIKESIIRAIDLEKKLFYLITPTPSTELSKVTIFARGTDIMVPQMLLESQPAGNVPYLSRPALATKSGIISDLYNGLKNIKTGRREYFPATS